MPESSGALRALTQLRERGVAVADEPLGKALVRELGIATPAGEVVASGAEAGAAASRIGLPVVLKTADPDVPHKTDVGGVAGPLHSPDEVVSAARAMRSSQRLLVEAWHEGDALCFMGLACESPFGPLVSFGLGGIWVEVLRDVMYCLAPVTAAEVTELLSGLRGFPLLAGARGRQPADLEGLARAISAFSALAGDPTARTIVKEIDVNPLLLRSDGPPLALDATAVLWPANGEGSVPREGS